MSESARPVGTPAFRSAVATFALTGGFCSLGLLGCNTQNSDLIVAPAKGDPLPTLAPEVIAAIEARSRYRLGGVAA